MAVQLKAEVRTEKGKGAARRLRRSGLLPGVVYQGGDSATSVAVSPKEFSKVLRGPLRRNTLINLELDGGAKTVMVKDIQIDPLRRTPKHVDFWAVDSSKPIEVRVPLHTTGRSKQVVAGAKLNVVLRTIKVSVLPDAIPEKIDHDITDSPVGPTRAKELNMPAGCTLLEQADLTVLTISRPRGAATTDAAEGEAPKA